MSGDETQCEGEAARGMNGPQASALRLRAHAARGDVLGHQILGGGAERVLVLHDWMGDGLNYVSLHPFLDTNRFTYVFADVRGYGLSMGVTGSYSSTEVAADVLRLADHLGWDCFHAVGHSMTGMAVQRLALLDARTDAPRVRSFVAITPVTADGYPADEETRGFLWSAIHDEDVSAQAFQMLTGQRYSPMWAQKKVEWHHSSSSRAAMEGYFRMWLDEDFASELRRATLTVPVFVIGGRHDLPGFDEEHLRARFEAHWPRAEFAFIAEAGHYPMHETPVLLASLIERFLVANG